MTEYYECGHEVVDGFAQCPQGCYEVVTHSTVAEEEVTPVPQIGDMKIMTVSQVNSLITSRLEEFDIQMSKIPKIVKDKTEEVLLKLDEKRTEERKEWIQSKIKWVHRTGLISAGVAIHRIYQFISEFR